MQGKIIVYEKRIRFPQQHVFPLQSFRLVFQKMYVLFYPLNTHVCILSQVLTSGCVVHSYLAVNSELHYKLQEAPEQLRLPS